jgi:hypothetical protein
VRASVVLLWLATAPAAWCQAADEDGRSAFAIIEDCSSSANEDAIGLTALEEQCPGLTRALEQSGYLALLSPATRDGLDSYDLSDIVPIQDRSESQAARNVDVSTLAPILDALRAQEPERPLTWVERLKRWLRTRLESRQGGSGNWLSRWLDDVDVPDVVTRATLLVALVLIIVLTIVVIVNELRAAGVFRKRNGAHDADMVTPGTVAAASDDVANLDALPEDRKAQALLRMLVDTLVSSGRLRTERSLTHRELCARAAFDDDQQRESFRRVAALAERTVYGVGEVSAAEAEPVVAAARALDAQLRAGVAA